MARLSGAEVVKLGAVACVFLSLILRAPVTDAMTRCSGSLDDSVKIHCQDALCFTAYADILRSKATFRGCYRGQPGCQDCPSFMKGPRAQLCCFCRGNWCNAASLAGQAAYSSGGGGVHVVGRLPLLLLLIAAGVSSLLFGPRSRSS